MAKEKSTKQHRLTTYFFYTVCTLQIILFAGCGSDNADPAPSQDFQTDSIDMASVQFSVKWHAAAIDAPPALAPTTAITDCSVAGIAFVTCDVYDESNAPIAGGGPWPCQDHGATVERIPPGTDRTFVVLGWDAAPDEGGVIAYQGITSGIALTAGEVADVGTIDATAFIPPEPAATAVYGNRVNLAWQDIAVPDAAGYRIYRNGEAIGDTQSTAYSDTNLTENTEYCYTISAYDHFDHESAQSDPLCLKTKLTSIYYRDIDEDDYGDPADPIEDTTQPTGYVADNTDCDDRNPDINPGAAEIFDGIDNDCDGSIDEQFNPYYRDGDKDGYGDPTQQTHDTSQPKGYVADNTDCDDNNADVNPGAKELFDGIDNDCDGYIDERFNTYYRDRDKDGYGNPAQQTQATSQPNGYVADSTDCDDTLGSVHPGAAETCNEIDDDCDGAVDENLSIPTTCGVGDCAGNTGSAICLNGQWVDNCNPYAGALPEVCDNADNDCDGSVDEDLSTPTTCGVGQCSGNTGVSTCTAGQLYDTCNPLDRASVEVCDDVDNDCDGDIDEDLICVDCYPNLPDPELELTSIGAGDVGNALYYYFRVNNRADYPNELFTQDPAYTACKDGNTPRTVVSFFDENNNLIKEDCTISSIDELDSLYFYVENGYLSPTSVYLSIVDQACGDEAYLSNTVITSNNPPQIASATVSLVSLNDPSCAVSTPDGSLFTVEFDYTDDNGNGPTSITEAHLDLLFEYSGGTTGGFNDYTENSTLSGDGYYGTATTRQCHLFGSNDYVDVTMTIEDLSGDISNELVVRIDKPLGSN